MDYRPYQYLSFSAAVVGSSHTKYGKDLEDCTANYNNPKMSLAVVADGHGADECFRSARGAKTAVECAIKALHDFINELEPQFTAKLLRKATPPSRKEFEELLRNLVNHIIARWHEGVEQHFKIEPFTPEELEKAGEKYREKFAAGTDYYKAYGTTLIAAACSKDYWFGIHIGDGRLTALYKNGTSDQPVPWDDKCFLNRTTSICDDDAAERARFYVSIHKEKAPPAAVFLCSDGVDDNYPVEKNEEHLYKLYRTIALTFAEDGFESTCKQIKELANSFATKGKGDDTSIAGFIDMDAVKAVAGVWRKQAAAEG
jgi:serine/threonine protein phosphatase PrpC